jgi:energy-coupling factor transporter transmembrane protein EcfT
VFSCLALVCAAQRTSGTVAFVVALAAVAVAWPAGRARLLWIARRTRILFAAILVLYAYSGSGPPLVPTLGGWSPTADGTLAGAEQVARLMAAIALSVRFFAGASRDDLISGLHTLVLPFARAGFPAAGFTVRVALMLRYAESLRLSSPRQWLGELSRPTPPADAGSVTVYRVTLGARDWAVVVGSVCLWIAALAR